MNPERVPTIKNPIAALTPRQREILQLIGEGKGTKEIATHLNVSLKTIDFHKTRLMQRLNIHTTAELMRYAITEGLACDRP
jgi:DNA-binding NarL/FixJ family response regulator